MSSRPEKPVFGFAFNIKVVSARVVKQSSVFRTIHFNNHPRYRVVLDVDARKEKTALKDESELRWDQTLHLQGTNISKLCVNFIRTEHKQDKTLGKISIDMTALAEYDGNTREFELVKNLKSKSKRQCFITITVSILKQASLASKIYHSIAYAAEQAGAMNDLMLPEGTLPGTDGVVMIGQDAWPLLMGRLSAFVKLVDKVSEVHPYAKLAWDATSVAYKLVRDQIGRDARINQFITCIWDSYGFVEAAEPLNSVKTLQEHIQSLALHTVEAAYFVRNYARFPSFGTRILVSIASDVDGALQQFEETFTKIQLALQQRITLESALTIKRISAKVEQIADDLAFLVLNNMCFHRDARYDPNLSSTLSLPNKTVDILSEWINCPNSDVPGLWLLTGSDRHQLSGIASVICGMFKKQNRLASSFFCHGGRDPTHPEHVLATIGRNLADYDDNIKLKLYNSLRKDIALCGTGIPEEQFTAFLAHPLKSCEADWQNQVGPAVVVINSVDLCGDVPTRERLITVLFGRAHELPSNIRILITSSPASDIIEAFKASNAVSRKSLTCTRMVGNHCLPLLIEETVTSSLSLMGMLSDRFGSDHESMVRKSIVTTLDQISRLVPGLTYDIATENSDRLLQPLRNLDRFIRDILQHASGEVTMIPDWLQPALKNLIVVVFLVGALNRNDIDIGEAEDITERIDKLLNEARSFARSNITAPAPAHPIRLLAEPQLRSCHPMFIDELIYQSSTQDCVIQSIRDWVSTAVDANLPRIFLLSGGPGSGKTSIAHSITRHFASEGILAWAFFHEICGKAECKEFLFASMSKPLFGLTSPSSCSNSRSHPPATLAAQLKVFQTTAVQYGNLGISGPVVFILDGLDQSFPSSDRKELACFLENNVPHLPPNFLFFVTWRSGTEELVSLARSAIHLKLTCDGLVKLDDGRVEKPRSDYAQELFDFVHEQGPPELHGRDPRQYINNVMKTLGGDYRIATVFRSLASQGKLSHVLSQGKPADLEELYATELKNVFPGDGEEKLFEFRLVMGICKIANEKSLLGLDFFDELPNADYFNFGRKASTWLEQLSGVCLVQIGSQKLVHVKKSFEDFLFSPAELHRYRIKESQYRPYVSHTCVSVMIRQLRKTPYISADSSSLKFACRNWSRHLGSIPMQELPGYFWPNLSTFTCDWIPEWIELLRKLHSTSAAVPSIKELVEWLLTRLGVDAEDKVACPWYNLAIDDLDHIRGTLQTANEGFELTMSKAETVLEPRLMGWRREELKDRRSRRNRSTASSTLTTTRR